MLRALLYGVLKLYFILLFSGGGWLIPIPRPPVMPTPSSAPKDPEEEDEAE